MAIKNKQWLTRANIKETTGLNAGPNTLVVISGPDFNIEVPKSIPTVIPVVDSIELYIDRKGKIEVAGIKQYNINTLIENCRTKPTPLKGLHVVTKKPTAEQMVLIIDEVIKLIEDDKNSEHVDVIRTAVSILAQAATVDSDEIGTANDLWHKDIVGVSDAYAVCLDVLKSYKAIIEKDPNGVNDAKYVKAVLYCDVMLYGYVPDENY